MSMTLKSMSLSIIAEGFPQTLKIKCGKKNYVMGKAKEELKVIIILFRFVSKIYYT